MNGRRNNFLAVMSGICHHFILLIIPGKFAEKNPRKE